MLSARGWAGWPGQEPAPLLPTNTNPRTQASSPTEHASGAGAQGAEQPPGMLLPPPPGGQEGGKAVKPQVQGPPGLPTETPAFSRNRWQEDLCEAAFPQGAAPLQPQQG